MKYPKHVAVIPDGNRTWAKEHGKMSFDGHLEGFQRCIELAIHIFENTTIDVFTLWGLSTENLKNRTEAELTYLFGLYKRITESLYEMMRKYHVNFRVAGDLAKLPAHLVNFLKEKMLEFKYADSNKTFVLAVNYGGQDEILRAVKLLGESGDEVSKENLEKYMDFGGLPVVDLVIRTKQKLAKRLSGFMLRRIGYAQLYFTDLYCPEFTVAEFENAVEWRNGTLASQNFGK